MYRCCILWTAPSDGIPKVSFSITQLMASSCGDPGNNIRASFRSSLVLFAGKGLGSNVDGGREGYKDSDSVLFLLLVDA
eukprot:CAMPEP_0183314068 /NCGR_PEP_ID=MMETSP0160_2-20130417/47382_1 /TAXON_ID=2839 ORGANISM="Odontella Sinensis, Strain Grunow 1884" /NCGR_SAMPLE_ID=MMETSP0160_2 /ASSEMBLY_ACC=CAM_ASM_000250 /LENGTH=78 /DNA_ID=CAMNT_0025479303 /DNA_START=122 /DNA_END=354 /DNA_ORIENTATION=-